MTKVQQKISGCFRSIEGAYRKQGLRATEALNSLFKGELPDFIQYHSVTYD